MTHDPTAAELRVFLGQFDADEFDVEGAIYWFASDWHTGQWSNLYSALSTSAYCPSSLANGPDDGPMSDMVDALEFTFGG
jgi:hypothetical protein